MSTLGKILTVLVVLVSIAVAVLVTTEIVLREKWKERYDVQAALYLKALEQRVSVEKQRDTVKNEWEKDAAKKQELIEILNNVNAVHKNTIATLSSEKENQEKRLQEAVEQLKGLQLSIDKLVVTEKQYRQERDDAKSEALTHFKMYTQLEAKHRETEANLANLKETLRQTTEEKAALESRLAYVKQNYPEVKIQEPIGPIPTEKMQGLVTRVDIEAKVAEINLGKDDGVVKGMKFFVYDVSRTKYLATVVINSVSNNSAAGELTVIRDTVKVNNHVTNRFDE